MWKWSVKNLQKVLVSGLLFLCCRYLRWGFERIQLDGADHVLEDDLFGECVSMIDDWVPVRPVPSIHCVVRKYLTLYTKILNFFYYCECCRDKLNETFNFELLFNRVTRSLISIKITFIDKSFSSPLLRDCKHFNTFSSEACYERFFLLICFEIR